MLHHVTITADLSEHSEIRNFYALLGFAEVPPPPALAASTTWMERDGTQIHITDPSTPAHHALVVPEYAATLSKLAEAGVETDPRAEHWGAPRCFVRDPAGNAIELMSAPPTASSSVPPGGER